MERQTKAISNPCLIQYFKAFSCKWLDFGNRWCLLFAVSLDGHAFNKVRRIEDNHSQTSSSEKVVANYIYKIKNSVFALIIQDEPEPGPII